MFVYGFYIFAIRDKLMHLVNIASLVVFLMVGSMLIINISIIFALLFYKTNLPHMMVVKYNGR